MGFNFMELAQIFGVKRETLKRWMRDKTPGRKKRSKIDVIKTYCSVYSREERLGQYSFNIVKIFEKDPLNNELLSESLEAIYLTRKMRTERIEHFKKLGFK